MPTPHAVMGTVRAALYLGISRRTLERAVVAGQIPYTRTAARRGRVFRVADLDAYAKQATMHGAP